MNKLSALLFLFLSCIFTIQNAHAQQFRKYSNEFLNIGVGGAAMGLGNTKTSNSNDLYSFYYNPAGLTSITDVFSGRLYAF